MNIKEKLPHALIIYGATGTGKTDFALEIARQTPSEIINMDVGSFYTPLTIGTAKPDWRSQAIVHHLFDIINEPENYTVVAYREACLSLVSDIVSRNKLPIIVGGSGFYLKSLFFPPVLPAVNRPVEEEELVGSVDQWWNQLYAIDPVRAQAIDRHDAYRIKRALQIWFETGLKPSEYMPRLEVPIACHVIHVYRDRHHLHERINKRVYQMMQDGWIDEVMGLRNTLWENFVQQKKIIGYNELLNYIAGCEGRQQQYSLDKVIADIQKKTRLYAKRQMTFWRMLRRNFADAQIACNISESNHKLPIAYGEINLTLIDHDLYIKRLLGCVIEKKKCTCFVGF